MITYNDLYEASRKERYSEQLQKLSKSFVKDVSDYLKEKKQMTLKEEGAFPDIILKTKKQLENAITLFKELILRRKKKILSLVLIATETGISKQDFDNMLDFEKKLFENFMKCMDSSDKELEILLEDKKKEIETNELILFKSDISEFVGLDEEKMGPYEKGQIVNLPKEIAKLFIENGKAELVVE